MSINIRKNQSNISSKIIEEKTPRFSATIKLDFQNSRLKLLKYEGKDLVALGNHLTRLAREHSLQKIIILARGTDWSHFLEAGYELETYNPYHFKGNPGYYLAKFLSKERKSEIDKKDEIVKLALKKGIEGEMSPLEEGLSIRTASQQDIPSLVRLYQGVFSSYPEPIFTGEYLETAMKDNTHFLVVTDGEDNIVSAASADMDLENLCAEITDCATLPHHRGKKLMYHLVRRLEADMKERGLISLYTIARAISPGINIVFSQNGYKYYGRFTKNCHISGNLEDMNLWVKKIK